MPWSLFNRPSIQLGSLKAYLEDKNVCSVDTFHPYLGAAKQLGPETYQYLSTNSWAGEALYAALLFPERKDKAEKLYRSSCKDNKSVADQFEFISSALQTHLEQWLGSIPLPSYDLIGFSVCFSQLFASLAAANKIKQLAPSSFIVFGGSSCVGEMGLSLMKHFKEIDTVISREGELQLAQLCDLLKEEKKSDSDVSDLNIAEINSKSCIGDLNLLPTPDYSSYFQELAKIFPSQPFNPILPVEFSRGCWWNRCTFCNLNLQWQGYRFKKSEKMVEEVHSLMKKHNCLDFTFCDNALPPGETDLFFSAITSWQEDISFFAEIRSIRDPQKLKAYHQGGLSGVQVGIEALSNSLLQAMDKGTTVIENLAVMKHCAENGITLDGNLIVEFPCSTSVQVEETLENLNFAFGFHPLSAATFFLGSGSVMAKDPGRYGINALTGHKNYKLLLPPSLASGLDLLIKDYRGDKTSQKKMWQPVRKKIAQWQEFHQRRQNSSSPPLSYRDGATFMVIRQERKDGAPLLHRLRGKSRELYLFCNKIKGLDKIEKQFPEISRKSILNFFADLSKKHLLYQQDNRFLALAIRTGKHNYK